MNRYVTVVKEETVESYEVNTPEKVFDIAKKEIIKDFTKEHFIVFIANAKLGLIGYEVVAIGGRTECVVDVPMVFRTAIVKNASGIVVAHNHPSGDVKPSMQDDELTKRLFNAGMLVGIKLLDSVIIGDKYYSYSHENRLYV